MPPSTIEQHTNFIKNKAKEHGFDYCGIAKANFLESQAPLLESWLKKNYNGQMTYMENYFDKRLDPRLLVDGAQSVISLLVNYTPSIKQHEQHSPKISKYAYGADYHKVIKNQLKALLKDLLTEIGNFNARIFVDSAPVMDKIWAQKSGLGWQGKHSNLITKKTGSYFFIAEIITDLALVYDNPINNYCGTCTRCIDACPTQAIVEPYVVDARKCISYLTIELKEALPQDMKNKWKDWIFGCDVCQDVCPWNKFAKPHRNENFNPILPLLNMSMQEWQDLTEETFNELFKHSPLKRAKYNGIKRNLKFIKTDI